MSIYGNNIYLNEGIKYESGKKYDVKFNGTNYQVSVEISGKSKPEDEKLLSKIDSCIKSLNSAEIWNYLFNYHKYLIDQVNDDDYFDGKKVNSGTDLKKSIESIKHIAIKKSTIYICGEYWLDPEHGFSICFPNGKFVKSKYDEYNYKRDEGQEVNYTPQCTILGQYASAY